MKPFKFFQKNDWYTRRWLRCITVSVSNLRFEIFIHQSLGEIQHEITNIIEPFLFEHNIENNRQAILRSLQLRFDRVRLLDSFEFDETTIPITHEII